MWMCVNDVALQTVGKHVEQVSREEEIFIITLLR